VRRSCSLTEKVWSIDRHQRWFAHSAVCKRQVALAHAGEEGHHETQTSMIDAPTHGTAASQANKESVNDLRRRLVWASHAAAKHCEWSSPQIVVPFSAAAVGRRPEFSPKGDVCLGQPVVITNRPGAGGTIAAGSVAKGRTRWPNTWPWWGWVHGHPRVKSLPYDTPQRTSLRLEP